ncbi:hypothetical protein VR41_14965, partial [Streptomyces sp. NRRL B-1568]
MRAVGVRGPHERARHPRAAPRTHPARAAPINGSGSTPPPPAPPVTVLIVDDDELTRTGLRALLSAKPDLD